MPTNAGKSTIQLSYLRNDKDKHENNCQESEIPQYSMLKFIVAWLCFYFKEK